MSPKEQFDVFSRLLRAYRAVGASRAQKQRVLEKAMVLKPRATRNHVRRLLKQGGINPVRSCGEETRGRKRKLSKREAKVLYAIWSRVNFPWVESFRKMLPGLVASAPGNVPGFLPEMASALLSLSPRTIQRALNRHRAGEIRRRPDGYLRPPRARNTYSRETSVRRDPDLGPGWIDADTVVHTNTYLSKLDAWSIMTTDCYSGWVSLCGVRSLQSHDFIHPAESSLNAFPFPARSFHSDNGSEFLNAKLSALPDKMKIPGTVSRPGKSNDNPRAEQKNGAVIRQYLGAGFIPGDDAVLINHVYRHLMRLMNWFTPSVNLIEKRRDDKTGKVVRRHDAPATPLDRLVRYYEETGQPLPERVQAHLAQRAKTNQYEVVKELMAAIAIINAKRRQRAQQHIKKEALYA